MAAELLRLIDRAVPGPGPFPHAEAQEAQEALSKLGCALVEKRSTRNADRVRLLGLIKEAAAAGYYFAHDLPLRLGDIDPSFVEPEADFSQRGRNPALKAAGSTRNSRQNCQSRSVPSTTKRGSARSGGTSLRPSSIKLGVKPVANRATRAK